MSDVMLQPLYGRTGRMRGRGWGTDKILSIRKDLEGGMLQRVAATKYKVGQKTVSRVARSEYPCLKGRPRILRRKPSGRAHPKSRAVAEDRHAMAKYGLAEKCSCGQQFVADVDLIGRVVLSCRCGRQAAIKRRYPGDTV